MGMKERKAAQWLQELTHELCWGIKVIDRKTGKPHPAYANTNKKLEKLAARRFVKLRTLTQRLFLAHFVGEETLYFTGSSGVLTLLMIDIDCHGCGTLQGAIEFARFLRDHYFPNLYFEPSTNGNGVHGYLVVAKSDDKDFNKAVKALDRWLKAVLETTEFDVEDVEIKGTCSIWERGNVTEGTLAKYPRDVARFDEWTKTTRLSVADINELVESSPIKPTPKATCRSGSIVGKHIDTETIKALLPFGIELLGQETVAIGSKNRAVVSHEDVAVFATLLDFFSRNENADGSMPVARIRSLWKSLFECGDTKRAWDHHRFMWLSDRFTALGLIEWLDSTYVVGDREKGIEGQACKWGASEKLLAIIAGHTVNKAESTSTPIKEERSILGWSKLLRKEMTSLNSRTDRGETVLIRPVRAFRMPWRWEDNIEKVNRIVQETIQRLEMAA